MCITLIKLKSWLLLILFCLFTSTVNAVSMLTLPGSFQPPGIDGTFSDDAEFSWIKHRFTSQNSYFSWRFGGGTDGGVIFDQSQAYTEMTDVMTMFNNPAGFYSVGNGLSIDQNNTINMSNLRMSHSGIIYDVGSGSGFDAFIPYVDDLSSLLERENGWSITNGNYHLFYNTRGICADCEMTIHMYGAAVSSVPVPASIWLIGSGLISLFGFVKRRKN